MPPDSDPQRPVSPPGHSLELNLTQVLASAGAAISAALAASYLGVAGTVIGAAVASAVSVTASALYSYSMRRTRTRLEALRTGYRSGSFTGVSTWRHGAGDRDDTAVQDTAVDETAVDETAVDETAVDETAVDETAVDHTELPEESPSTVDPHGPRWWVVAGLAVALFAVVIGGIAVVETVTGRTLTDLVHGRQGSGGTSVGTLLTPHRPAASPSPTPSSDASSSSPTSEPSVVITPTPSLTPTPSASSALTASPTLPAPSPSGAGRVPVASSPPTVAP